MTIPLKDERLDYIILKVVHHLSKSWFSFPPFGVGISITNRPWGTIWFLVNRRTKIFRRWRSWRPAKSISNCFRHRRLTSFWLSNILQTIADINFYFVVLKPIVNTVAWFFLVIILHKRQIFAFNHKSSTSVSEVSKFSMKS